MPFHRSAPSFLLRRPACLVAAILAVTSPAQAATASLTLDQAQALARKQNPEYLAFRAEVDALRGSLAQPPSLPSGLSSPDLERATVVGRRVRAAKNAAADGRLAQRGFQLDADVRAAFARCLAGREFARIAEQARGTAEEAAKEAKDSSAAAALEGELARVLEVRFRQEVAAAQQRLASSVGEFLRLLGASAKETLTITGSLAGLQRSMELGDHLVDRALDDRMDLQAARKELEAALDVQAIEGASATASKGRQDEGRTASRLSPVDLQAARSDRALRDLEREIWIEVSVAMTRVHHARNTVSAYASGGLQPFASQMELLSQAHRSGTLRAGELSSALRDIFEAAKQHIIALEELAVAEANLVRALGAK